MDKSARKGTGSSSRIGASRKLTAVFTMLFLVALGVAGIAVFQINTIGDEVSAINQKNMPMLEIIGGLAVHQLEQRILLQRMMRLSNGPNQTSQLHDTERDFSDLSRKIRHQLTAGEKIASDALAPKTFAAPRNAFEDALATLQKIQREHRDFRAHTAELLQFVGRERSADATLRFGAVEHEAGTIATKLNSLLVRFRANTEDSAQQMENYKKHAFQILTVLLAAAAILGFLCVWMSLRGARLQSP